LKSHTWVDAGNAHASDGVRELTASSIGAIAGGSVAAVITGFTWAGLAAAVAGVIVGAVVALLTIFMFYLINSPKGVDEKRKKELATAQSQTDKVREELTAVKLEIEKLRAEIAESQNHKLIFEIDERNTTLRLEQTNSAIRIWLHLQLRFENKDIHPLSVKSINITLHRMGIVNVRESEDVFTLFAVLRLSSNGAQINKDALEGLTIAGRQVSPFYLVEAMIAIEDEQIETAKDLSAGDYLLVTMQSSGHQPEFTAKLHPHWEGTLEQGGTRIVHVIGAPSIPKDYRRID
jgi:hypothetical protein